MHYLVLVTVLFSSLFLTACGPAAIVGAIGSAITRTAYENDAKIHNYSQSTRQYNHSEVALANLKLGIGYLQEGQYELALEKLSRAREAKPDYPPTYNALGVLYQKLGKFDIAEDNFKKAIKLNPKDSSTLNNYGLLLCQTRRFDEADEIFLRAVDNPLYTTPELAYNNAGTCALNNGQIELAEHYFKEALKRNAGIGATLIQMSELSYGQGNYMPARGYLNRYLEYNQQSAKSLWLGIRIERELGDKDAVSSYALLLRNQFTGSKEAELLRQSLN